MAQNDGVHGPLIRHREPITYGQEVSDPGWRNRDGVDPEYRRAIIRANVKARGDFRRARMAAMPALTGPLAAAYSRGVWDALHELDGENVDPVPLSILNDPATLVAYEAGLGKKAPPFISRVRCSVCTRWAKAGGTLCWQHLNALVPS